MLAVWASQGRPRYETNHSIAFISDVGAQLKPLFISASPPVLNDHLIGSDLFDYRCGVCVESGD